MLMTHDFFTHRGNSLYKNKNKKKQKRKGKRKGHCERESEREIEREGERVGGGEKERKKERKKERRNLCIITVRVKRPRTLPLVPHAVGNSNAFFCCPR